MNWRDAVDSDAASINAIYNDTVSTTTVAWTEELETLASRRAWMEQQRRADNPVLVAVENGRVVGFGAYGDFRDAVKWPGYRFTVEHTLHIDGDHQGVGIGGALLDALIGRATAAGKHSMIGAIDGDNAGSIRFHERHGFTIVGRLPELGFKFGRWLELVLMQRPLA